MEELKEYKPSPQWKLKKFIMAIFEQAIKGHGKLKDNEHIRIFQNNKSNNTQLELNAEFKEFSKTSFFNDIDDIVEFAFNKNNYYMNTYFNLATTNGEDGTKESLINRYCLAFDFDKKELGQDFNHKDIYNLFKKINLHYHILISSGNGYHVYVLINKTDDIKLVSKVTNLLINKLGADTKANLTTQVLRVPYTWNIKDKRKQVKIIHQDENIYRYDIEKLAKKYCRDVKLIDNTNTKYVLNMNIKPCVAYTLEHGSQENCNNYDLQRIIVELRNKNKSLQQILAIAKEWNSKNQITWSDSELDYQAEYIYNNLTYVKYECDNCDKKDICYSVVESDFIYSDDDKLITVSETTMKALKKAKRKGVKCMEGNDLVIYGILKLHNQGLFYDELEKELTYKKKCRFSKPTVIKALNNLADNGFIEVENIGKKKFYKLVNTRSKVELTYNISYGATFECVKGNITSEELRLYNYLRYLHHKEQRENPKALKGNIFQMNQIDIAKEFGVDQPRISLMINNLVDEKLMSIWYRQVSNNNGFDYYVYTLNY